MAIDILDILSPLRPWVFVAGPSIPRGGRTYTVVAFASNTYTAVGTAGNVYSVVGTSGNTYSVVGAQDMATELPVRCYRGEPVTINFSFSGIADLTGRSITFRQMLHDKKTVLATLNTLTDPSAFTISGGDGVLSIPGGRAAGGSLTDRAAPADYYYTITDDASPMNQVVGTFSIDLPSALPPALV